MRPAIVVALLVSGFSFAPAPSAEGNDTVEPDKFSNSVRPILARHCFKCHGPDEKARKAGLRLDVRSEAIKPTKSGVTAIVPGRPDESEVVSRIFAEADDEVMPPPQAKLPLKDDEKQVLKTWIAGGAGYTTHWSFVPTHVTAPPQQFAYCIAHGLALHGEATQDQDSPLADRVDHVADFVVVQQQVHQLRNLEIVHHHRGILAAGADHEIRLILRGAAQSPGAGSVDLATGESRALDARLRELLRRALDRSGREARRSRQVTIEVTPRAREVEVAIGDERCTLPVALLSGSERR